MKLHSLLPFAALCLALPIAAQEPPVSGNVTDAGTPARFVVDRTPVLCSKDTMSYSAEPKQRLGSHVCPQHRVGDSVTAVGKLKSGVLIAETIDTKAPWPAPVDGTAVIEHVTTSADGTLTLQADGYRIRITPKTKQEWLAPLSNHTVAPNLWLNYSGTQEVDGTVTATTLTYSENALSNRQAKHSKRSEFDPGAVTEDDRQGAISSFFKGADAKRLPAYKDAAMQQRVEDIGAKLVPAFQRALPEGSSTKLNFRFQVVDADKLNTPLTLTNGIILVPMQVVERLENDSQLATALADNIACAIEKQEFRQALANQFVAGSKVASLLFGLSGLGAAEIGGSIAASKMLKHAEEQSGRVSLSLLHDAGYDITQAPVTWWILDSKKPRIKTDMPYRSRYLYNQLATTWRIP